MLAAAIPLVAVFATSVLAQGGSIPGLPSCAQGCVTNYGGCNQVDVKCICSNKPLLETLSCCVSKNCDAAGTADVISFANSLCGSFGVTTLPTAATCASTAATASPTASGTKTGTATMSMTSAASGTEAASASSHSGMHTHTHTGTGTTEAAGTATSAAASASQSALAIKNYKAEGLGLGMAVLGFLAGL